LVDNVVVNAVLLGYERFTKHEAAAADEDVACRAHIGSQHFLIPYRVEKMLYLFIAFAVIAVIGIAYGVWVAVWSSTRKRSSANALKGLKPVPVEVPAYLGLWYEHRRMNSRFEPADFVAVTARYSGPGGAEDKIIVVNYGESKTTGKAHESVGNAVPTNVPGVLNVSFFPGVGGAYVVIGLRPNYSIVASPSRDYLWLLGRSKEAPDDETIAWFSATAVANGYPAGLPGVVSVEQP
jgi:lipocalin